MRNILAAFDFSEPLDADTTIYAKISKVETTSTRSTPQKDETPKTGVENYLGIAVRSNIILSSNYYIHEKEGCKRID